MNPENTLYRIKHIIEGSDLLQEEKEYCYKILFAEQEQEEVISTMFSEIYDCFAFKLKVDDTIVLTPAETISLINRIKQQYILIKK